MSSPYTPNPANNPTSITRPVDGDGPGIKASDVSPAIEGLADKIAWTQERLGGRLVAVHLLTAAAGTFVTGAETKKLRIRGVGGGASGGGATSVAAAAGVGGGGGAGGYVEHVFDCDPNTGLRIHVRHRGLGRERPARDRRPALHVRR